ncbi:hypothetical protein M569_17708 [Genlisea aurea]|uniref:Uncharacterized protein n=1 Tax=Genlisea aurea TaxID=192259 RepID=S8BY69_9LAMI|nr:hypothetical protein M569_17708 [Genlisea aurea]
MASKVCPSELTESIREMLIVRSDRYGNFSPTDFVATLCVSFASLMSPFLSKQAVMPSWSTTGLSS